MKYRFIFISVWFTAIFSFSALNAQFVNHNFTSGSTGTYPHTITGWVNGYSQWVPENFVPGKDPWIDLTGTGYGNGFYIEQSVYTSSKTKYRITFDLGTFYGWDLWDAGVSLTMDGVPLGGRIWHDSFTYTQDTIIYWKNMSSIEFYGTDTMTTFRFTGDSRLVQDYGWGRGVGVIAIDNILLNNSNLLSVTETGKKSDELKVYPNPCRDIVRINIPNYSGSEIQFYIYDIIGSVIAKGETHITDETITISTADLVPGNYLIQVEDSSGKRTGSRIWVMR